MPVILMQVWQSVSTHDHCLDDLAGKTAKVLAYNRQATQMSDALLQHIAVLKVQNPPRYVAAALAVAAAAPAVAPAAPVAAAPLLPDEALPSGERCGLHTTTHMSAAAHMSMF